MFSKLEILRRWLRWGVNLAALAAAFMALPEFGAFVPAAWLPEIGAVVAALNMVLSLFRKFLGEDVAFSWK